MDAPAVIATVATVPVTSTAAVTSTTAATTATAPAGADLHLDSLPRLGDALLVHLLPIALPHGVIRVARVLKLHKAETWGPGSSKGSSRTETTHETTHTI